MGPYRVNLDIFAGPLDLLLYLVRKDEVDIYDIPIASITKQYIQYAEMLKQFDIDLAGDFVVMAATLMEIKSVMLLPRVETEEGQEGEILDPRAELVRQLLEYKKFKDAANLLNESASERKQRFTRPGLIIEALKDDAEPEFDLDEISIWTLLEAFDAIMQATGRMSSYDHIKDDTPIDLYQIEVLHRLQEEGPMVFENIFKDRGNRLIMMGLFLAMLELIRNHLIWVEQPDQLGPIYVKSITDEPAEEAVQNAIRATLDFEDANEEETSQAGQVAEVVITEPDEPDYQAEAQTAEPARSDEPVETEDLTPAQLDQPKSAPIPIQELPAKTQPAGTGETTASPDESINPANQE